MAALVAAMQLLSVEWAATAHAQLEAARYQATIVDTHTPDCAYVHNDALCPACAASTLVAPTSEAPVRFSLGNTRWILSSRVVTVAWSPITVTANSVRAPPPVT
jgi:hypothetical protein